VAGAQRRQPPLPPVHAPNVGAAKSLITDALPLPAPSPTASTTTAATVAEEGSLGHRRCDAQPASIAELRRRLCTPPHTVDLDRLPIKPRDLLRIGGRTRHYRYACEVSDILSTDCEVTWFAGEDTGLVGP
jgi:hypothetical protein